MISSSLSSLYAQTDVNVKRNLYGDTPLHIAAVKGDLDSARALIRSGADLKC